VPDQIVLDALSPVVVDAADIVRHRLRVFAETTSEHRGDMSRRTCDEQLVAGPSHDRVGEPAVRGIGFTTDEAPRFHSFHQM
jgi:hypothetical protein